MTRPLSALALGYATGCERSSGRATRLEMVRLAKYRNTCGSLKTQTHAHATKEEPVGGLELLCAWGGRFPVIFADKMGGHHDESEPANETKGADYEESARSQQRSYQEKNY